jgi:hypothetical protein
MRADTNISNLTRKNKRLRARGRQRAYVNAAREGEINPGPIGAIDNLAAILQE